MMSRATRTASFAWFRRRRQRMRRRFINTYSGATVDKSHRIAELSDVEARRISATEFFRRFVATRMPVILRAPLAELHGFPSEWWMRPSERAGQVEVEVECRNNDNERFGHGNKQRMGYADLVRKLREGSTRYYLTTQADHNPADELVSSPLKQLAADLTTEAQQFPLQPALLSSLVPQSVNLWLGRSADSGTSSGLHHDFHDNLYISPVFSVPMRCQFE